MEFIYLVFYACLRLQFLDVETNHGPRHPVPDVCRILCSNVQGLAGTVVCCQVRANETYSEAKHQFSDRNRDVLMNVQSPHMWWSTLKSEVLGSSSSLPPLVMRVVDWCVSRLVRMICCRIVLTASSPGRLLIYSSLVIRLLVLSPLPSGRVR